MRGERREQPLEIGCRKTRPRGIVHQHPVIGPGAPLELRERAAHRLAALRTPADRGEAAPPGVQARGHLLPGAIPACQRHDNMRAARIGEKGRERPFEHRASCERRVLLGCVRAEAAA